MQKRLEDYVVNIPDFPKKGILFRDVTGITDDADGFRLAIDGLAAKLAGVAFDRFAAVDARGFIFAGALADRFRKPLALIRKPGKLPRATLSEAYALEYGTAEVHLQTASVRAGDRVVVIDDLLATGGTAAAAARLVERAGGTVAKILFAIELAGFDARATTLAAYDVDSLIRYPGT